MKISLILLTVVLVSASDVYAGERMSGEGESFAEEYSHLRQLLEKVQTRESAITYKSQIAQELKRLKDSQINGGQSFDALSEKQQQAFIKKFQNNQFHCSEVTQVMEERRRILLDPDLNPILSSLMQEIP